MNNIHMELTKENKLEEAKIIFKKLGFLDNKSLETLKFSKLNKCNMCNKLRGSIAKLTECNLNSIICLECIDDLYDNYTLIEKKENDNILFKCLCCNNNIINYVIE